MSKRGRTSDDQKVSLKGAAAAELARASRIDSRDDDCWTVVFVVDGQEIEGLLPSTTATDLKGLKRAVASLASSVIGDLAPTDWASGKLSSLNIQYLTPQARFVAAKASTEFRKIHGSSVLRVSWQ